MTAVWSHTFHRNKKLFFQYRPAEVPSMNEQYAVLITGFPLFKGFTVDGARMLLDSGEVKEFSPGEVLIKEGDEPKFVLLVVTGRLQVFVQRQGRDLVLTDTGRVRSWVNWQCYAASRDRLRCARARNRRHCNGAPRLFAVSSSAMPSYRNGYSGSRCAPSSRKSAH